MWPRPESCTAAEITANSFAFPASRPESMKVTYPLSLKVSLWLMANLLLLAALGVGFFLVQGGLDSAGPDSLGGPLAGDVMGPSGARLELLEPE